MKNHRYPRLAVAQAIAMLTTTLHAQTVDDCYARSAGPRGDETGGGCDAVDRPHPLAVPQGTEQGSGADLAVAPPQSAWAAPGENPNTEGTCVKAGIPGASRTRTGCGSIGGIWRPAPATKGTVSADPAELERQQQAKPYHSGELTLP